jgi:hypothetical protein
MATLKTVVTKVKPVDFIKTVEDEAKRKDCMALLKLFKAVTGEKVQMWGTAIVGFGSYHYKSERSTQEGDWPLTGFSPRKQNLTLYIMPGFSEYTDLLKDLGKHKISGGSCIYINKLSDIDLKVLAKIIKKSVVAMKKRNGIQK